MFPFLHAPVRRKRTAHTITGRSAWPSGNSCAGWFCPTCCIRQRFFLFYAGTNNTIRWLQKHLSWKKGTLHLPGNFPHRILRQCLIPAGPGLSKIHTGQIKLLPAGKAAILLPVKSQLHCFAVAPGLFLYYGRLCHKMQFTMHPSAHRS